ncbi:MAG: DUF116 domain-containing protein [Firmicutes bacterium]|nr:DUF116 domain-containing protein [Bacillota bacterium]
MNGSSEKLYLKLMAGVGLGLVTLGALSLLVMVQDLRWEQLFVGSLFVAFAVLALIAFVGLIAVVYLLSRRGSFSGTLYKIASGALYLLYRPAVALGRLLAVDRDSIRGSFVQLHNRLAERLPVQVSPDKILLLAPICMQWADCPRKVTVDVTNCVRCGKCRVGKLLDLKDRYGVHVAIATGGTLARKLLKDIRPRAVVAIACERDLVSGLQDTRPLLVIGVTNERPNGPCYNTTVNLELVEQAILRLADKVPSDKYHRESVSAR